MAGELTKRLRRMKDGVIYGYSDKLAQSLGMEIVMCDEHGEVREVIGEVGARGVYGRTFVGTPLGEDEVQSRLHAQPPKQSKPPKRGRPRKDTSVPLSTGAHSPAVEIGESLPDGPDNTDLG